MSDKRLILALDEENLPRDTGFMMMDHGALLEYLEAQPAWFGPREILETFDAYRQLIPYIVLVHDGKVVTYTRTPSGGESRLHGKISFGLGGHIDLDDAVVEDGKFNLSKTLLAAAQRELQEEVGLNLLDGNFSWQGLLTNLTDDVGRVHQGVVAVLRLDSVPDRVNEDEIGQIAMKSHEELAQLQDRLETWSAHLLPRLSILVAA